MVEDCLEIDLPLGTLTIVGHRSGTFTLCCPQARLAVLHTSPDAAWRTLSELGLQHLLEAIRMAGGPYLAMLPTQHDHTAL